KEDRAVFKMPEGGADSHGDGGYRWEGREFLEWLRDNKIRNVIVVGGDRHWQFHSVDPISGTHEFGCGPVTDKHAKADPPTSKIQRFVRGAGGFLSIRYTPGKTGGQLTARLHNVNGGSVHEHVLKV